MDVSRILKAASAFYLATRTAGEIKTLQDWNVTNDGTLSGVAVPFGQDYDRSMTTQFFWTSTPVEYYPGARVVKTESGSEYQLGEMGPGNPFNSFEEFGKFMELPLEERTNFGPDGLKKILFKLRGGYLGALKGLFNKDVDNANPGGADGNLLTNYVDDGESGEDEDDVNPYSDEELHDRFLQLLEQYGKKKKDRKDLSNITPESEEIPELTRDMGRTFFGVDLAEAKK